MENVNDVSIPAAVTDAAKHISIQRTIDSLVHAVQCKDDSCQLPSCPKMKRLFQHTKICKQFSEAGCCMICKQLIALCCYHAKHCKDDVCCRVPFCSNIKYKIKLLQNKQRVQPPRLARQQAERIRLANRRAQQIRLARRQAEQRQQAALEMQGQVLCIEVISTQCPTG